MRWLLAAVLLLAGCTAGSPSSTPRATEPSPSPSVPSPTVPSPTAIGPPAPSPTPTREPTPVPIRVESRVPDVTTAQLREAVAAVLADPRGWQQAGFVFHLDPGDAPYQLVLAEGPVVDQLCLPLDTDTTYSCQNGPVVALNADRWRTATPSWPGTLGEYRTMLVNHEVGHLLHLHHPMPQCPGQGLPAPVMAQQSATLDGCLANPWPLRWEIELAARSAEPRAPPADHDTRDHQPSPPAATE